MKSFQALALIAGLTQAGSTVMPASPTQSTTWAEPAKAKSTVDAFKVVPAPAMKLKELIEKINSKREADEPTFEGDEPRRKDYFYDEDDEKTMYPEGKIVVDLDTDTKAPSQDESMEKMMQSVMEKIREEIRKYKKPQEMHNFDPLFEDSPVSLKDSTEKPKPYGEDEAPESVKPQDMATQQESEVELNTLHVGQRLRHAI